MARKTFRVSELLDMSNSALRKSTFNPDIREGIIGILEEVLHETGNYRGYGHLVQDDIPEGQRPGVVREFANCDQCGQVTGETRRVPYQDDPQGGADILCQTCWAKNRHSYPKASSPFNDFPIVEEGFTHPDRTRRVYFS